MRLRVGNRRGFVLPLILVLFLCLGISTAALFYLPGNMGRMAKKNAREMQEIYDAESSIVACLAGFPQGYFGNLPEVNEMQLGPYKEICAPVGKMRNEPEKGICVLGVERFRELSVNEWMSAAERYRRELQSHIESFPKLKSVSGNKRFFSLPSEHFLQVQEGDLLLDAEGQVRSANYEVDGNVTIKGSVAFDTLRVYSRGHISVKGRVSVRHLETSGTEIDVDGDVRVRGILLASKQVTLAGRARAEFPSFGVGLGLASPEVNVKGGAVLEGAAFAPGGLVQLDAEKNLRGACWPSDSRRRSRMTDSSKAVLPAFFGGKMVVFGGGVR